MISSSDNSIAIGPEDTSSTLDQIVTLGNSFQQIENGIAGQDDQGIVVDEFKSSPPIPESGTEAASEFDFVPQYVPEARNSPEEVSDVFIKAEDEFDINKITFREAVKLFYIQEIQFFG